MTSPRGGAPPKGPKPARANGRRRSLDIVPSRADRFVDELDLKLLNLLHLNGRLSVRALAREVSMSASTISDRIARLESAGILRGYHAAVNVAELGYGMQVLVGVQVSDVGILDDTVASLAEVPEIAAIHVVTGPWDVVVHAQVRDHDHLRDLLLDHVSAVPGFRRSETMVVLESHWQGSALLAALTAPRA